MDEYLNSLMEFQFPFHRDRLCNLNRGQEPIFTSEIGFNSLFIGIGSAIKSTAWFDRHPVWFQFPFHRDRLCNTHTGGLYMWLENPVSIPFSSG
ncbi:hypothetical protein MCON_3398 [Methanothrix soehngenii GP6]|uniref:Uncharacterized protein n=1 Tax=Methanothrix soehngenii (strain ATCC 5969 / DSM 3671 / JCM 10134 / NBRC 103675 / OCM 69 / GP-6) TaxID=990316 RepID=F4BVM9_METSG|nr:hypothetical protein MCON_3398 [Methanothrix soehngenii GP6]